MRPLCVALLTLALTAFPARASEGPVEADHVVAVTIPGGNAFGFSIWCEAAGWRDGAAFDDVIVGEGAVYEDPTGRVMSGNIFPIGEVRSSRGSAVVVGDTTIVADTVEDPRYRISAFGMGVGRFGIFLRQPVSVVFSVAAWGAEPRCEVDQGGPTYTLTPQQDARAFHVGPYAFTGGAHVQDRRDQVAAARAFVAEMPGGPTIGHLRTGHLSAGTVTIVGGETYGEPGGCDPVVRGFRDGCTIEAGSYGGDAIAATIPASWSLGGWDVGFYAIGLASEPEVSA